jgi:hypothetical protein
MFKKQYPVNNETLVLVNPILCIRKFQFKFEIRINLQQNFEQNVETTFQTQKNK